MATLTSTRAASTFPVFEGESGQLAVAYGTYELAANPTANDIIKFCKVPAGAVVVGGRLYGDDIDTGTEAFDLDIGTPDDPDMFGNFGVLSGDAVAETKPEVGINMPLGGLLMTTGPQEMTAETTIQGKVIAAANAGGTGTLTLVVYYTMKTTTT